jgi:hypothetical protein
MGRRSVLKAALGLAGVSWFTTGCAPFANAGRGVAFEPWAFPGDETRPEYLAVRAAILAANPHNTQPWAFRVTAQTIDVFVDEARALGAMDSLGRERFIGVGCAIENAVLAAQANGRAVRVEYQPAAGDPTFAARLTLTPAAAQAGELYDVLATRRMNKCAYADAPVPAAILEGLAALVDDARLTLRVVTDVAQRAQLRQQSVDSLVAIIADDEMARSSHHWWRQTDAEIQAHRDGLNLDILGLDATTRALAGSSSTASLDDANTYWLAATRDRHTSGAGYFILSTTQRNSRTEQLLTGRLFQRAHLYLTTRGVDMHCINMLPERQDREESTGATLRPFSAACDGWVEAGHGFQMLTRFGYSFERPCHTPRRAVEEVLR